MSIQNKLILRRFFEELFNQGNLAAADEIVSTTYINHNAAPGETPGRAGLTQFVAALHVAFRDLNFAIADQIAEGDKVTTRWSVSGIHQGTFAGIPTPANRSRSRRSTSTAWSMGKSKKAGSTGMRWGCCNSLARYRPKSASTSQAEKLQIIALSPLYIL